MKRATGRYRWRCTDHLPCVAFGYAETDQAATDELFEHNKQAHPPKTEENSK